MTASREEYIFSMPTKFGFQISDTKIPGICVSHARLGGLIETYVWFIWTSLQHCASAPQEVKTQGQEKAEEVETGTLLGKDQGLWNYSAP